MVKKENMKSVFLYLGLVTQLGLTMVISIMAGLFVGIFMDRLIQTKMIFTIIFVIFGVIGGFIGVYKSIATFPRYPSEREDGRAKETKKKD